MRASTGALLSTLAAFAIGLVAGLALASPSGPPAIPPPPASSAPAVRTVSGLDPDAALHARLDRLENLLRTTAAPTADAPAPVDPAVAPDLARLASRLETLLSRAEARAGMMLPAVAWPAISAENLGRLFQTLHAAEAREAESDWVLDHVHWTPTSTIQHLGRPTYLSAYDGRLKLTYDIRALRVPARADDKADEIELVFLDGMLIEGRISW